MERRDSTYPSSWAPSTVSSCLKCGGREHSQPCGLPEPLTPFTSLYSISTSEDPQRAGLHSSASYPTEANGAPLLNQYNLNRHTFNVGHETNQPAPFTTENETPLARLDRWTAPVNALIPKDTGTARLPIGKYEEALFCPDQLELGALSVPDPSLENLDAQNTLLGLDHPLTGVDFWTQSATEPLQPPPLVTTGNAELWQQLAAEPLQPPTFADIGSAPQLILHPPDNTPYQAYPVNDFHEQASLLISSPHSSVHQSYHLDKSSNQNEPFGSAGSSSSWGQQPANASSYQQDTPSSNFSQGQHPASASFHQQDPPASSFSQGQHSATGPPYQQDLLDDCLVSSQDSFVDNGNPALHIWSHSFHNFEAFPTTDTGAQTGQLAIVRDPNSCRPISCQAPNRLDGLPLPATASTSSVIRTPRKRSISARASPMHGFASASGSLQKGLRRIEPVPLADPEHVGVPHTNSDSSDSQGETQKPKRKRRKRQKVLGVLMAGCSAPDLEQGEPSVVSSAQAAEPTPLTVTLPASTKTREKKHKCDRCNMSFDKRTDLYKHQNSGAHRKVAVKVSCGLELEESTDGEILPASGEQVGKAKGRIKRVCETLFSRDYNIRRHFKKKHKLKGDTAIKERTADVRQRLYEAYDAATLEESRAADEQLAG